MATPSILAHREWLWAISTPPDILRRPPRTFRERSNNHPSLCRQTRGFSCLLACVVARVMPISFIPTQLACGGVLCSISWRLVHPPREGKPREVFTSSGKPLSLRPLARYSALAETSCLAERRNLVFCRWAVVRAPAVGGPWYPRCHYTDNPRLTCAIH
jgi:hypothetical protein